MFEPAVVIGAALGGPTGLVCQQVFTSLNIQPGAFAAAGMAGFLADAEAPLVASRTSLRQGGEKDRLPRADQRLVEWNTAWGETDQAAQFRPAVSRPTELADPE